MTPHVVAGAGGAFFSPETAVVGEEEFGALLDPGLTVSPATPHHLHA